ncbi:MAG: DUF3068 domain-containing protein [Streptosporangiales bacterium]|nr:DUF3068 domain-containing protein [Streptosporangiales bacterium]
MAGTSPPRGTRRGRPLEPVALISVTSADAALGSGIRYPKLNTVPVVVNPLRFHRRRHSGGPMRRGVGLVLIALGAFLVTVAPLARFWVAGQLAAFPLDQYSQATLEAQNAKYFSQSRVRMMNDVTIRATNTIRGDVTAGNNERAVWDQYTWVEDTTNNLPVQQSFRRVAFDRRTGEIINCCDEKIDTDTSVRQTGWGFVFPMGTKKQDYPFYDTAVRRAVPMRFIREEKLRGLDVYRFEQRVPPTRTETREVPGSLVGEPDKPSVQADMYVEAVRTYWVEPTVGSPVNISDSRRQTFRVNGVERATVFLADLKFTERTLSNAMTTAEDGKAQIRLVRDQVPIGALAGGALLLLVGGVMMATGRGRD